MTTINTTEIEYDAMTENQLRALAYSTENLTMKLEQAGAVKMALKVAKTVRVIRNVLTQYQDGARE